MANYLTALKMYNQGKKWNVPVKGSVEYLEVMKIYQSMKGGDIAVTRKPKREPVAIDQSGEGIKEIVQTVKNGFDALINGKRKGLSPSFKKSLKDHGDKDIVQISIIRKPVQAVLKNVINFITLGKFNSQMKSLNYDEVYHLSAILKLADGTALFLSLIHI